TASTTCSTASSAPSTPSPRAACSAAAGSSATASRAPTAPATAAPTAPGRAGRTGRATTSRWPEVAPSGPLWPRVVRVRATGQLVVELTDPRLRAGALRRARTWIGEDLPVHLAERPRVLLAEATRHVQERRRRSRHRPGL